MAMVASLLLAAPSPPATTSWRGRSLLLAATPPALRLRPASASSAPPNPTALVQISRQSRRCENCILWWRCRKVGVRRRSTDRGQAPDLGALARRVVLGALLSCAAIGCGAAVAAEDSIKATRFGLRGASELRRLGWPEEAVVFTLATLPVLELRGAIPAGYWMRLDPIRLTVLSVIGNMVPEFIILYLKKLATFLSRRSASATRIMDLLFERARRKAAPVEEFQCLG